MSTENKASGNESVLDALAGNQDLEALVAEEGGAPLIGASVAEVAPEPVIASAEAIPADLKVEQLPAAEAAPQTFVEDDPIVTGYTGGNPVADLPITFSDEAEDPADPSPYPAGVDDSSETVAPDPDQVDPVEPLAPVTTDDDAPVDTPAMQEDVAATEMAEGVVRYAGRLFEFKSLVKSREKSKTVVQTRPYQSAADVVAGKESLTVSNLSADDLLNLIMNYDEKEVNAGEFNQAWHAIGNQALNGSVDTDTVAAAVLARKGAQFRQGYLHGQRMALLRNIRPNSSASATEGEQAVLRVMDAFQITAQTEIFLPNSGYWVKLQRPHDEAIINTVERIESDAVLMAQETYGRSFSTRRSLLKSALRPLLFEHTLSVSIDTKGLSVEEYLNTTLSAHDEDMLVWGLSVLIWQDGWQYYRQIVGDGDTPNQLVEQVFDVRALMHIDNDRFSKEQIEYIVSSQGKIVSEEQRQQYLAGFKLPLQTVIDPVASGVKTRNPVRFVVKTPLNSELITVGEAWVRSINKAWEESISTTDSRRARREFLNKALAAARMRNYEPWVSAIEIGEGDSIDVITNRDTIAKILTGLSPDDGIMKAFEEGITRHMEQTSLYVTGIPALDKKFGEETIPGNPYLIPLDTLMAFFIMLRGQAQTIATR